MTSSIDTTRSLNLSFDLEVGEKRYTSVKIPLLGSDGSLFANEKTEWTRVSDAGFPAGIEVLLRLQQNKGSLFCIEVTIRNTQAMDHSGGNWDLGASGYNMVHDFTLNFNAACDAEQTQRLLVFEEGEIQNVSGREIEITQYSSGGKNQFSKNHIDRDGNISVMQGGYRITCDQTTHFGRRASPQLYFTTQEAEYLIEYTAFWESFPSSLCVQNSKVSVGLFPRSAGMKFELQGGEQKTFEILIQRNPKIDETERPEPDSNLINKLFKPKRSNQHLREMFRIREHSPKSDSKYDSLVNLAISGPSSFIEKREAIDEYGWRNYGDIWADHEAIGSPIEDPLISHNNNQYDCTLAFAIQYLRTEDNRWLDLMVPMADHAWDIDTYHTDQDKLLYNGGLFWPTYHYADAHTSTHRSYPRQLKTSKIFEAGKDLESMGETGATLEKQYAIGGGPAASHNYNTGWMLAYYITGKERYREAAVNAAQYVLKIDDGNYTPFRWLTRGNTGHSISSGDNYYGPGRASANSTHALLTGHQLTGDKIYLDRTAEIMRRTVHPYDDLEKLDLLNAELRWFYTMYLQSLGRYLDYKIELNQKDQDFLYGVACLRHYARWMAKHEVPTLSKSDHLQYPTETWAAQDLRKWHILEHAARYEDDPLQRTGLLQKADFFYNYCMDYLTNSETNHLCRPLILTLNHGWQRDWYLENRDTPSFTDTISEKWDAQLPFVPQREIAIRRFKKLILAAGLLGVASASVVLAYLF